MAETVCLDQLKMSHLLRRCLASVSVDCLLNILNRLGHNVEVPISAEEYNPDASQTLDTVI
jgi:predicted XRE-type DNA-binding protein